MANYNRLRDDFINLASVPQDFNQRLKQLEDAVAKLSIPQPEKAGPVFPVGSMTVQTFLKATGMNRSSFYVYAKRAHIDIRRFGRRNYILNSELEQWLRELKPR